MKKLNTIQIVNVYRLLNNGTLAKIEKGRDRYSVIKALRVMKPIVDEYESSRLEALKKLREGHDKDCALLDRLSMRDNTLTPSEIERANQFAMQLTEDLNWCMKEINEKEHSLEFEPLSEETFMGLLEGNDWHAEDCMFLEDLLR